MDCLTQRRLSKVEHITLLQRIDEESRKEGRTTLPRAKVYAEVYLRDRECFRVVARTSFGERLIGECLTVLSRC